MRQTPTAPMPFPLLCFVLVSIALAVGDLVAEQTADLPITERVQRHLDALQSDAPAARQRSVYQLMQLAIHTNSPNREAMIQAMLRYSLWSDLETQLSVDRLVDEIRILEYQEHVERLLRSSPSDEPQASPLRDSWDLFSARADQDDDARAAFRQIALQAGPSLDWRRLHARVPSSELDIVLISHLGCLAPKTPELFRPQSRDVFSQLMKMRLQSSLPSLADANGRVIGRLIDRTVEDNPYGWSIAQRLHVALAYQRHKIAATLCDQVLQSEQPLARDLAVAMLAWPRIELRGASALRDSPQEQRIIAALSDRRVVCVPPVRIAAENQCVHRSAIIRTRVQDVAGWALIQGAGIDAHDAGLLSLRADPVWGIELASIGFAAEPARERFLAWLQIQLASND